MTEDKKLKISESYIVGVDISEDDIPMAFVTKYVNYKEIEHINTFVGDEAIALYKILKGDNEDE